MTKNGITRRKILASIGAVGAAGAGLGMGTSAYFQDEERFEENTLAAGELDLKVDWEEHYSYPQLYGFDDPTTGLDIRREDPEEPGFVGLPDPENPMVWVPEEELDEYMSNTAIEAFPDPNNDGEQEISGADGDDVADDFAYLPCIDGSDLPEHLDPVYLRTDNSDTRDRAGDPEPLMSLEDVKPGDFGEFTLSFHLCDNPGHVWLRAENFEESENGITDPEADADAEDENERRPPESDDGSGDPELAERVQTAWWLDDGNNVIDSEIGKIDVMIAVDTSNSLTDSQVETLQEDANQLGDDLLSMADAQVGCLAFGQGPDSQHDIYEFEGLAASQSGDLFSGLDSGGGTPLPAVLDIASQELDANSRSDAESFIVVLTDGGPDYINKKYSANGYTYTPSEGTAKGTVTNAELRETADVASDVREDHRILVIGIGDERKPSGRASDGADDIFGTGDNGYLRSYLRDEIVGTDSDYSSAEAPDTVTVLIDEILEDIAMREEVFLRGSLEDVLTGPLSGKGRRLDGNRTTEGTDCFAPGTTHYIGFAWWLPEDVGNEVQSDSVSFDFGFYTEQCRNNDEVET